MMKKFLLCIFCLLTSVSFAGQAKLHKVSVVLDWFPNPDHAPLVVAQQRGFFKEEGLEVNLISPADPTEAPKMIAANKADIGITYEPEFMQQVDRGLPLVRLGTLIDKPLNCLVALKNNKIKSLSDLKGKRIGITGSGLSSIMLKVMLKQQGLADNDVELITVRYNLTQALLTHHVDAVTGMMRNFEVPQLELNNHAVEAFFPEEHGIPNYDELIFVINRTQARNASYQHFLNAIKKAVAYLDEHPKEAWSAFVKQYPEANNNVNREAWFATLPYFAEDPAAYDTTQWQRFSQFMHQNGLIKTAQPASHYNI